MYEFVFVLYLRWCYVVVNDAVRSRKEISACFCLLELRLRSFLVCWRPSTFVSRIFFEHESFQVFVRGLLHRASPAVQNNYSHWSMPTSSAHQHQSSPNNTPVPPRSSTPNTTIDPTLRLHGGSRLELGARLLVPLPGRPPN